MKNKPGKAVGARATRAETARKGGWLTPALIVRAALKLIDSKGFAAFSTRQLGQALSCEAMSIYHHFPSKQHLLDALVDHVIEQFRWPPAELEPIERLRRICHSYRELAHGHPRFFPYVAVHRLNTPRGVDFIERVLVAFEALVSDREQAARWFRVFGYYLVGSALDETSGYAAGPSAAEPVSNAYISEQCPRLAAAADYFDSAQWEKTFALGLEALLAEMLGDRR